MALGNPLGPLFPENPLMPPKQVTPPDTKNAELAARMQLAAPEALDLASEPAHVLRLYGLEGGPQTWPKEINSAEETWHFSRKCLAARRLLERGVRFVQIWSGNDNSFPRRNWDSHEDVRRDHGPLALGMALSAGRVVFGAVGDGERLEFTVIGDAVNFTAKLEKHNKEEGTRALTDARTYALAEEQGYNPREARDRRNGRMVAGVAEPIDIVVLSA